MKRLFIFTLYVVMLLSVESTYANAEESQTDYVQFVADRAPVLERGDDVFSVWLQREVYNPYLNMPIYETGEVLVSFVVERDGEVSSVEILSSPSRVFSDIVREAMSAAPTFKPAVSGGQEVRFSVSYVISFIAEMGDVTEVSGAEDPFSANPESSLMESHGFSFSTEQDSTYVEFNQMVNESIFSEKTSVENQMLVKSIEVRDFDINKSEDMVLLPEGVLTATRQPRMVSGAPYVEYLDWVFDNVSHSRRSVLNKNSTEDGRLTLSMIHDVDGSVSAVNIIESSDKRLADDVVALFNVPVESSSVQCGALESSYRSCLSFSFQRLRERASMTFSSEVHGAIANDIPLDIDYVDELPAYDGEVVDAFMSRLSKLCYDMLPDELRSVSSTVRVKVTLGKDGAVLSQESYGSNNEKLIAVVQKALLQMPSLWSPARVYDSPVSSIVTGVVIFTPKQSLRQH